MYDWRFLASELNERSLSLARENVRLNRLEDVIEVRHTALAQQILIPLLRESDGQFDFCMCNPPFFSDRAAKEAKANPHNVCAAVDSELCTAGGEEQLVVQMVRDSVKLGARVRWYSSLIGRKGSLQAVRRELRRQRISNVRETSFRHGRTSRWAIAWSHVQH
jgi:U6 snRNA m6A methyltransferase